MTRPQLAMQSFSAVPDPFTILAERLHVAIRCMSLENAPSEERRTLFASANGLTTQVSRARGSESLARRFNFFSRALEYLSTVTRQLSVLAAIGAAKPDQVAAADELIAELERFLRTALGALAASLGRTSRNRSVDARANLAAAEPHDAAPPARIAGCDDEATQKEPANDGDSEPSSHALTAASPATVEATTG